MSNDLITVATFATSPDASPAQSTLEANGIRTYLQGGTSADVLSYYGTAIGGVKLQVATADVPRALQLLGLGESDTGDAPSEPWNCSHCGTHVDAGFEICWSCGTSIDGTRPEDATSSAVESEPSRSRAPTARCPMCGAAVSVDAAECTACGETLNAPPIPPPEGVSAAQPAVWTARGGLDEIDNSGGVDDVPEHVREMTEKLTHAFRAAVIGILFCPPLMSIYSMYRLTEYHRLRREYDLESNWRATFAGALNWIVILIAFVFLLMFFTEGPLFLVVNSPAQPQFS